MLWCLPFIADAMVFDSLGPSNGMSHGIVVDICQDKEGYLWFATNDGVNRYDGYSFEIYRNLGGNVSLDDDKIAHVLVDCDGYVWAVCSSSISRYDSRLNKFINYQSSGLDILSCASVASDRLIIFLDGKVICFTPSTGLFVDDFVPKELANQTITAFYQDGGKLVLGNSEGMMSIWDVESQTLSPLKRFSPVTGIQSIYVSGESIWVGTEGTGIFELSPDGRINARFNTGSGLLSNSVRSINEDSEGRIWVGTFGGLNIITKERKIESYFHDREDPCSISANSVRDIFRDSQNGMWLATYYGGVNYWHPDNAIFQKSEIGNQTSENINIQKIYEDPDGILWMGLSYFSVTSLNPSTGATREYRLPSKSGKTLEIKCFFAEKDSDELYIGSQFRGLLKLNKRTGLVSEYDNQLVGSAVYCISQWDMESILLCTSNGVFLFNKKTESFTRIYRDILNGAVFSSIVHNGKRWFGGTNGIRVINCSDIGVQTFDLSEDLRQIYGVSHIFKSSNDDIYICSNKFYRYIPSEDRLLEIDTGRLVSGRVTSIIEDAFGRLWLYTNSGICKYSPSTGNIRLFGRESGLYGTTLGASCIYMSSARTAYFGTREDVRYFLPDRLKDDDYSPKPVVTEIKVCGKHLDGDANLSYSDNTITFKFSTFNYKSSGKDVFSFRLKGYEDEWHYKSGTNEETYYNLPAGRYSFELRAANADGIWSKETVCVPIEIHHFWVKSPLFIICIAFIFLFIMMWVVLYYLQKKEKEHIKEIYDLKDQFYISTLNELKTPLTLISSPIHEMIVRTEARWMRDRLRFVEKNAEYLSNLIDQTQMLRRAELNVLPLKVARVNVNGVVLDCWKRFCSFARDKGIKYHLDSSLGEKELYLIDRRYLILFTNILLSGAFKLSSGGSIDMGVSVEEGYLLIKLSLSSSYLTREEMDEIMCCRDSLTGDAAKQCLSAIRILAERNHCIFFMNYVDEAGAVEFGVKYPQMEGCYSPQELSSGTSDEDGHFIAKNNTSIELETFEPTPESLKNFGMVLVAVTNGEMENYLSNSLSRKFTVICASTMQEALSMLMDGMGKYDAVITSSSEMFDFGIQLCSRIKHDSSLSHLPVLVISSRKEITDRIEIFQAGADSCIMNPFSINELTIKLRNICLTHRHGLSLSKPNVYPDKAGMALNETRLTFNENDDKFLAKATEFVMKNIDNADFSARALIVELGMSRTRLYHKFKTLTGESPIDFINRIRFNEAARLLQEKSKSISEISEMVGFKSPSYFSRAFRRYFGVLPSHYSNKIQQ